MNVAGFAIGLLDDDDREVTTLTPLVDGRSLVELVGAFEAARGFDVAGGYAGIAPSQYRFGDLRAYLLGMDPDPVPDEGSYLLGCDCGELGCWPLVADIRSDDSTVTWSGFAQPHRRARDYTGFGPFTFDRGQYEAALVEAIAALGDD